MAISIIGTPQVGNANNGGTVTITFSTAPSAGDYTVAIIGSPAAGAAIGTISTSGYTLLTSHTGAAAANPSLAIWYKKQGASPDTTVAGTSGNGSTTDSSMIAFVLRGVDPDTFSDATPTTAGETTSDNPDPASITVGTSGACVIVAACMTVVMDTSIVAPSGYTGYSQIGNDDYDHTLAAAYKLDCSGTEAPASWTTWSSGLWYAITIAVKPDLPKSVSVYDSPTATESVTVSKLEAPATISVNDTPTVTESITVRKNSENISSYDSPTATEVITISKNSENINIYDISVVTEGYGTFGTTSSAGSSTGGGLANCILATKYTLSERATINKLSFFSPVSGNLKGAIYGDLSGVPNLLIVAQNTPIAVTPGSWSDISITPTTLDAGTYWITSLCDTNGMSNYKVGSTNQAAYNTSCPFGDGFTSTFPTPSYQNNDYICYGTYYNAGINVLIPTLHISVSHSPTATDEPSMRLGDDNIDVYDSPTATDERTVEVVGGTVEPWEISVYDETIVTEGWPGFYDPETINISEYVEFELSAAGPVLIIVDDSPTVTDSVSLTTSALLISVSDSPTTSDVLTEIKIPILHINVSDTPTVTDGITVFSPTITINVSHSPTATEGVTVFTPTLTISVNETPTATDYAGIFSPITYINVNDSPIATDSITIDVVTPGEINVSDSPSLSDWVSIFIPTLHINVNDTPTASDVPDVSISAFTVSVSDYPTATDVPIVLIVILFIDVSDSAIATDEVSLEVLDSVLQISLGDDPTVTEYVTVLRIMEGLEISVSDSPLVTDYVSAVKAGALDIVVYDYVGEYYKWIFTDYNRLAMHINGRFYIHV